MADACSWASRPSHRRYLLEQAFRLLEFHRATCERSGRFVDLDDEGQARDPGAPQQLVTVARAVHSYALGEILGVPGCRPVVEQGLEALWHRHRDDAGGYREEVDPAPGTPLRKAAYGHAFVLLAAASARQAGHDTDELFDDVLATIDAHFWSEGEGASREAFDAEWRELEPYRGANSNMHLVEALLAADACVGDHVLAGRAERIARLLIDRHARERDFMLPEHYDERWEARADYNRERLDDPFRPYGVTIGHLLEWSRLLCAIATTLPASAEWLHEAAEKLFSHAVTVGWDQHHGGLAYTVDFDGSPANPDHYWWPIAEGIQASAVLAQVSGTNDYEIWYRRFWDFASTHLIDHRRGGWFPQLDAENRRMHGPWFGKPDLYHALQACLVPLMPAGPSVAGSLAANLDQIR